MKIITIIINMLLITVIPYMKVKKEERRECLNKL